VALLERYMGRFIVHDQHPRRTQTSVDPARRETLHLGLIGRSTLHLEQVVGVILLILMGVRADRGGAIAIPVRKGAQ
jgi:hypothetical protein